MILLLPGWEEAITQQYKNHKRYCLSKPDCFCHSVPGAAAKIKIINKEILAGRARVTETIFADAVILHAGL